ncbi:MAG: hypothetical protein EBZ13_12850, partial [Planctomycetia bacterium]|nr:hypothetical protein [Planctomycetia bacterium]
TSSTSADPIRHSNGYRFFNNSHGYNGNGSNRHVYNYNSRFNRYSSFNISYSRNRNFQNNDIHGSRYSYRPYSNDGLSVRLNYGTGYIGTARAYNEGGYETKVGSSFVGPEAEEKLLAAMQTLLEVAP